MNERKLIWQGYATWTTYAGKRGSPDVEPEVYFPVDALGNPITDPILAIREAVLKCSEADGGTVFVGCDYPDDGDAFLLDYLGNYPGGLTGTLLIKDCHNVVIDFGGATIRQVNFARRVKWGTGEGPPEEGADTVEDDEQVEWYLGVGHPILRIENCTNLRIENLNIDGNRTATTASSWGTHAS